MKALSILQPWAEVILAGYKSVENRSWRRDNFPRRFLIHAGKKYDGESECFIISTLLEMGNLTYLQADDYAKKLRTAPRGAILGEATIEQCVGPLQVPREDAPWAFGPWCYLLGNVKRFGVPVPYRGELGFFEVALALEAPE